MTTYEVAFKVRHDCPFNDLSRKFPSIIISHWCDNEHDILEVSYDTLDAYDSVQEGIHDLAKKLGVKITKKVFTNTNQQLFLGRCNCDHFKSVCPTIERNHCLELKPTIYKGGWEWYRVIAFSDHDIKRLFKELGEFCEIEVTSRVPKESGAIRDGQIISTSSLFAGLTDKQLKALLYAIGNGYYRVPKKITTSEIANLMGVPRTTYEEHLRKAESKILVSIAPYLQIHR